jgi:hypothetical protein
MASFPCRIPEGSQSPRTGFWHTGESILHRRIVRYPGNLRQGLSGGCTLDIECARLRCPRAKERR